MQPFSYGCTTDYFTLTLTRLFTLQQIVRAVLQRSFRARGFVVQRLRGRYYGAGLSYTTELNCPYQKLRGPYQRLKRPYYEARNRRAELPIPRSSSVYTTESTSELDCQILPSSTVYNIQLDTTEPNHPHQTAEPNIPQN